MALWLHRWRPKTFVKKLMWRLFWNKIGWGPHSVTSHMNHMMSLSVMHLGGWILQCCCWCSYISHHREVFYIRKCGKLIQGLDKFPKSCRWGAGRAMHYRHRTALWRALWLDSRELVKEIKNFPHLPLKTMSLLERITFMHDKDLSEIYPNVWTALRIALPLPVTVAQAESSFSN